MSEIKTVVLPLSVQWWTPARLAEELGKSERTINRRHEELVARRQLTKHKRRVLSRAEAQILADYVVASGRPTK